MKTKSLLLAVAGLALAAAAGGWWWQGAAQRRAVVLASLPPPPDLSSAPASLPERIAAADTRARSLARAQTGLAELSRLYHANGYLEEAARCYDALEQLDPREPRWPHRHATILAGYGEIEPAAKLWLRVTQLAPDYLPARLRLGDCDLKANRLDEAAAIYAEVLKRSPDNPYATLGLARIDFEAARWEPALVRLEALVAQTNYQLGYDLIVSVYERLGRQDRAAAIRGIRKAFGAYRDPADPWLDELLDVCVDPYRLSLAAGAHERDGDTAGAISLLLRALDLAPNDVSSHFQLGNLYVGQSNFAAGREQLERCTTLAPDFSDGWARLSDLQEQTGDRAGAARTLQTGLRNCPQSPGLHQMAARNLQKAGRLEESINEYLISIRFRPNEPDAYVELAKSYFSLNRVDDGVAQMRAALEADPGDPRALSALAFYAIATGDLTDADKWLARVAAQPRLAHEQREQLLAAYRKQFGRDWTLPR